jgi:hypothetical protein
MQKKLHASNALELMEYDAAMAVYPMRMAEWNALPAEGRGAAAIQPAAVAPVAKTLFWDPLGQLWELFYRLYSERSSSRIEEYRDLKPLPGESTPNMMNRLDLLHMQLEAQSCKQSLNSLMLSVRTCAQRCSKSYQLALHTRTPGLSVVPVRLRKRLNGMPQSCLCTLGSPQGLGGVTTMLQVYPPVPLQPIVI